MTKHIRDCINICDCVGLDVKDVRHLGRHVGLMTDLGMLVVPCTPSDRRWRANMRAQARRMARHA
jgi:hypothetical protein